MRGYLFAVLGLLAFGSAVVSCDDDETYAEKKEREAKYIKTWLANNDIDVISMSEFLKDTVTSNPITGPDSSRNEYVVFSDYGVYMQIIKRGKGDEIPEGKSYLNARFVEIYPATGDTMSMNLYEQSPDQLYVSRSGAQYTASFLSGVMANNYGNTVPNGWLMSLPYLKPGVLNSNAAKVRLIVPHTQGTQTAASDVYPAVYELQISIRK